MIEYLKNEEIAKKIASGDTYQKSAKTFLRLPQENEMGNEFITYVKDGQNVRVESTNTITEDVVVARNPGTIGKDANGKEIYNEWLVPKATAIKNYGQSVIEGLSHTDFSAHKKAATIKAIEVTPEILTILGINGDTLEIKVSWAPDPMIAKVGDYITDAGYSVSKHDMLSTYDIATTTKVNLEAIDKVRKSENTINTKAKP